MILDFWLLHNRLILKFGINQCRNLFENLSFVLFVELSIYESYHPCKIRYLKLYSFYSFCVKKILSYP